MFKLEHSIEDKHKAKRAAPTINQIRNIRDEWEDDYAISQILRKKFREEKKEINKQKVFDWLFWKKWYFLKLNLNSLRERAPEWGGGQLIPYLLQNGQILSFSYCLAFMEFLEFWGHYAHFPRSLYLWLQPSFCR